MILQVSNPLSFLPVFVTLQGLMRVVFFFKKSMFLEFIIIINRRAGPVQTNPQLLEASFQQQTPDTRS